MGGSYPPKQKEKKVQFCKDCTYFDDYMYSLGCHNVCKIPSTSRNVVTGEIIIKKYNAFEKNKFNKCTDFKEKPYTPEKRKHTFLDRLKNLLCFG